jgi:nitrous oxidase accessory protein NosD
MKPTLTLLAALLLAPLAALHAADKLKELAGAGALPAQDTNRTRLWTVSDTRQLRVAIRHAHQAPGTIQLMPGTYLVDEPLVLVDVRQVSLLGGGWNTVLQRVGSGDLLVLSNVTHSAIRNLRLQADPQATNGSGIVFVGQSSSDTVDYLQVVGFPECGIEFRGSRESQMSSHTVKDSYFINNRKHQLHLFFSNDFFVSGNQFGCHGGKAPLSGAFLENASAGTYDRNYHWDNQVAFRMRQSRYNRIENNRFEESTESGMLLGDPADAEKCDYAIITGNTIHSNSKGNSGRYSAVVAWNCDYVTFCQNQVFSWGHDLTRHCLEVGTHCASWIIKDNILRSNREKPALKIPAAASSHIVKDNLE